MLRVNRSFLLLMVLILAVSFGYLFAAPGKAHAAPVTATTVAETASAASTATATPAHYNRIFYYVEGINARESFFANADSIDVFAPQSYSISATGALTGSIDPTLLAFAADKNIKVMPLVTNQAFDPAIVSAFLSDPTAQASAISALVAEAQKYHYWGWQVDFEQMDLSDRAAFSTFMQNLDAALKSSGLVSSVAVVSQTSQDPADYPAGLWQKLIGVYDYAALASTTDIVTVMSYDDPQSAGPVVRYSWLKDVLAYSLRYIPADKLSLGLALYYWQWNTDTGKRVGIGGAAGINNVLAKDHPVQYYSTLQQAPYMTYTVAKKNHYLLWYENGRSIAAKIALIKQYGLNGFSAWALGLEEPSVYSAMKE